jgi:serine protease AprX
MPTIAIVDSGIEPGRADFGGRLLASVNLTSLVPNSPGDGRGHGTFVASVAAGAATGYTGAAPGAGLVSLDVMDDYGMARTSDVITAADWILRNRAAYNIRVANFSLHTTTPSSFMYDPLDKAVERLWFSGVTVVTAAGNYASNGQASGVPFAPGNDPFVITVGAVDTDGSVAGNDDFNAPWSAYGYTLDGFAKPELAAPGRHMVAAVPANSTLALERPTDVVAPGYMQLSGTSFSAPVVAGAATTLLAAHPSWTPDQVKGALMLSARPVPTAAPLSTGVGEVNAAAALLVDNPPNPNVALEHFLVSDPLGGDVPVFDAVSWASTASSDPSWASVSWAANVSWASLVSWASVSWSSVSWASVSWASVVSWASSVADVSWASNAESDSSPEGGDWISPDELAEAEAALGMPPSDTTASGATVP